MRKFVQKCQKRIFFYNSNFSYIAIFRITHLIFYVTKCFIGRRLRCESSLMEIYSTIMGIMSIMLIILNTIGGINRIKQFIGGF